MILVCLEAAKGDAAAAAAALLPCACSSLHRPCHPDMCSTPHKPCAPACPPCSETPLLLAARRGHTQAVQLLLQHGAATDKPNSAGVTPLIAATLFGHDETVAALLARCGHMGC